MQLNNTEKISRQEPFQIKVALVLETGVVGKDTQEKEKSDCQIVAPINKLSLGLDEILVDVAELVATRVMTDNIAETIKAQDIQMNEEQVKKSDLATVTSLVGRLPIYTVCQYQDLMCMRLKQYVVFGKNDQEKPIFIMPSDDPKISFVITPYDAEKEGSDLVEIIQSSLATISVSDKQDKEDSELIIPMFKLDVTQDNLYEDLKFKTKVASQGTEEASPVEK